LPVKLGGDRGADSAEVGMAVVVVREVKVSVRRAWRRMLGDGGRWVVLWVS
jgi:hypothetical protein